MRRQGWGCGDDVDSASTSSASPAAIETRCCRAACTEGKGAHRRAPARSAPGFEKSGGRSTHEDRSHDGEADDAGREGRKTKRGRKRRRCAQEQEEDTLGDLRGLGEMSVDEARQSNKRRIFHYDDGSFSMKTRHFDWKGICKRFGWERDNLCGPVVTTFAGPRLREQCCMDSAHK